MGFRTKLSGLTKNRFLKNVAVLSGGTLIAQVLPILFTPLLGRLYNDQAMGIYTIYVSIINITQQIACFRYDYAIVVADDDEEAGGSFLLSCLLAVGFSLLMAVIMWPFIPQIGGMLNLNTPMEQASLWAVPFTTLICGTTTAVNYFNVRHEKYKTISSATIIKAVASIVIQIGLYYLFVALGWREYVFWGLVLGQLFSNFFGNLRMFMTLRGRIHRSMFRLPFLWEIAKKNSHYPKYMLPSGLANSLTMNITPLTISAAYSVGETGLYGMVNRILGLPLTMISNSVSQVFLKQASMDKENKNDLDKTFANVAKWLAVIGIIPFAILFLFGEPLLRLFLGSNWTGTGMILKLVIPLFAVRFVVVPLTSSAIALGKQKATMIWQFCMLGTALLPSVVAIAWDGLSFRWYLLISSLMMAGAYLVFYRFCQNVVRNAGKQPGEEVTGWGHMSEAELPKDRKGDDAMDSSQRKEKRAPGRKPVRKKGGRWKALTTNRPFMIVAGVLLIALIVVGILVGNNIRRASITSSVDYGDAKPVVFQDKNLEKEVSNIVGKSYGETLYDRDLELVTRLVIVGNGNLEIESLDDLEACINIETLEISGVKLRDISAVGNMTGLRTLNLSNNKIEDISALANCRSLTYVNLASNRIQDITPLYELEWIEELNLSINKLINEPVGGMGISADIQKLSNLRDLNLANNQITDVSIFSNLPELEVLYLASNDVTDVAELHNVPKLREYNIQRNSISNITSLGDLPSLSRLTLSNNLLADIHFLRNYPQVEYLSINGNIRLSTLEDLAGAEGLMSINIQDTQIQDLSVLEELSKNHRFCGIYLDEEFDRSKINFMVGKFRMGDIPTRIYINNQKYNKNANASGASES